ncbi:MAG: glycosyltransferase [Desulfovibrionaceae bacterium]
MDCTRDTSPAMQRLEERLNSLAQDPPPAELTLKTCLNLRADLADLLVRRRPELEAAGLLLRPYRLLAETGAALQSPADSDPASPAALAAALLPIPGQWARLNALQDAGPNRALQHFLRDEAGRVQTKAAKKFRKARQSGKHHKPWNFLQILKPPVSEQEKGVLRVFSMPYLLADARLVRRLGRDWVLLVEPAAGVNLRHDWMRAFLRAEAAPVFGVVGPEDAAFLRTQGCRVVNLAHSDYLPEDQDVPLGGPKRFDLLLVGLYDEMERKRHGLLLDLLLTPRLAATRALVLGRGAKESFARFQAMVSGRGLGDRVTARANLERRQVPALIDACRLSLNLSLHENGCRAIAESLRSDVPVAVSACAAGVNFEQITPRTGVAASDPDLPDAIAEALARLDRFTPRQWFLQRSGSANSSRELNRRLQAIFEDQGMDWTRDIVGLTSSGAHRHADPDALRRLLPHYRALAATLAAEPGFGLPLECPEV